MNTVKVTFSIDEKVLNEIDSFASDNGMSRSEFLKVASQDYIKSSKAAPNLKNLFSDFMRTTGHALAGDISPNEYKARLDDMQNILDEYKA